MKNNTAMEELIEEFEYIKDNKCKTLQEVMFFDGVLAIIEGKYLEKEKRIIVEAFNIADNGGYDCPVTGEQYYSQTFKKD